MKLRNIFTMLAAALVLCFVGCQEPERFLDEVRVSQSYISIPKDGGEVKVVVDAQSEWTIVALDDKSKPQDMPEWLTVSPVSGGKGKTEVVFSAGATTQTYTLNLNLVCDGATQKLKVVQVAEKPEPVLKECQWINDNGEDGVTYRAKGVVTVVNSTYATYGGFSINDGTGTLVIYGSDTKGDYPDLAVGDEVIVEGQWGKKYANFGNGSQIISLSKSLLKVEKVSPAGALAAQGDVFTVTLTNKAEELVVTVAEDAQSWITYTEPMVLGTTCIVEFTAAANESTPRKTTIKFSTVTGGKTYEVEVEVEQNGSIPQLPVADAIQLPADSWFAVAGTVTGIHKKGFVVTDAAGDAIYAYTNTTEAELGAALGDNVVVTGKISSYGNFYQIAEPQVEVVSSGNKVSYGAPVSLESAASFEAYKEGTFSSIYIEATGVTTGQYGDITIGDWVVSPYQTSETINIAEFKDKNVKVRGYILQYKSPNILRVMLTSVKEDTGVVPTIADVLAAGAADEAETKGVVVATYGRGALINDGTASILLYNSDPLSVAVGDEVKVAGKTTEYAGMLQFAKDGLVVTKLSSGNTVNRPAPTVLDAAGMESMLSATSVQYIEYTGTLSVSGNYYNVAIEGTTTAQGSLQYIDDAVFGASALNGKKVKVTGYFIGVSSGKFVNTMTVSIEEVA